MKFLCPRCDRLADLAQYRVETDGLWLRCQRCGESSRVDSDKAVTAPSMQPPQAASPARGAEGEAEFDPFRVPEGHCPKCVAVREANATACGRCGLRFEQVSSEDYRPSSGLARLWRMLLVAWEDPKAHDRFIAQALELGELPMAGRLYAIELAKRPQDASALRGREEVLKRVSTLAFTVAPAEVAPGHWGALGRYGLIALVLAVACALLELLRGLASKAP